MLCFLYLRHTLVMYIYCICRYRSFHRLIHHSFTTSPEQPPETTSISPHYRSNSLLRTFSALRDGVQLVEVRSSLVKGLGTLEPKLWYFQLAHNGRFMLFRSAYVCSCCVAP